MEDLFRQLQEELRLLREEREKDKIIRLALEKKLQEAGILAAPVQEQQPLHVTDEVELNLDEEEDSLSDLSDVPEDEEVPYPTPPVYIPLQDVSPKPERNSPTGSSKANIITPPPPKPIAGSSSLKAKKMKPNADASAFMLSVSRRAQYMEGSSLSIISPPALSVSLSRAALNTEYGCTTMGLLWRSPKGGKLQYLFPSYQLNPDMPRGPGEPGLLLGCRDELWTYGPWTLFYHLSDSKLVRMGYAGEYKCHVVGAMPKEEFAAQNYEVKKSWADKIATRVRYECYVEIRARITLRKENPLEEPTKDDVKAKVKAIKRMKRAAEAELTCQDVIDAFTRGEESIQIIRTECVGYDHAKAEHYLPLQAKYEELQELKTSGKVKSRANSNTKTKLPRPAKSKSKPTKSRKRALAVNDISGDNKEDKDDHHLESEDSDTGDRTGERENVATRPAKRSRYTVTPPPCNDAAIEDVGNIPPTATPQRPVRSSKQSFKVLHGE